MIRCARCGVIIKDYPCGVCGYRGYRGDKDGEL